MNRPRLTVAQQGERRRQLDAFRLQRRLTPEERAEADDLAERLYMRVWAASLRQSQASVRRQECRS